MQKKKFEKGGNLANSVYSLTIMEDTVVQMCTAKFLSSVEKEGEKEIIFMTVPDKFYFVKEGKNITAMYDKNDGKKILIAVKTCHPYFIASITLSVYLLVFKP
jgi:hypothetical protein